jgi:hypothetical protein
MPAAMRVDPKTGLFIRGTIASGPGPLGPAPIGRVFRRRPALGSFGDTPPNQSGAQGALIAPYDEGDIWNPSNTVGSAAAVGLATSASPTPNPAQTGFLPQSAPYGQSDRPWSNPTTFATVPINASTNTRVPVLSQNSMRNALIIQNGSLATVSGDVAPTLYVNFNAQPQIGSALALPPGVGIAWDIVTPRDSIYIAFGPFTNTGGSVVIQGAVIGGTYVP